MYKLDLALNDLQWSICHKTKPNQTDIKNFCFILSKRSDFHIVNNLSITV